MAVTQRRLREYFPAPYPRPFACLLTSVGSDLNSRRASLQPSDYYLELAGNLLLVLILLSLCDHLIIKQVVKSRVKKTRDVNLARWFFIHSLANGFVCLSAISSIKAVVSDPINAFDGAAFGEDTGFFGAISIWPLTVINAVHFYHMIGGFQLTAGDYFHHFLFIPTIALPGQLFRWGPLANFQAFFISGLPGGVDYLLLGLQKLGALDHLVEKRVNANLNSWCRAPGILFSTVLCYQGLLYGRCGGSLPPTLRPPVWAMLLQLLLPPYNGLR